jgi:hypothetical protein
MVPVLAAALLGGTSACGPVVVYGDGPAVIGQGPSPSPSSKRGWCADALLRALPRDFPAARAVIFYDEDSGGGADFRATATPCSQAVFAAAISTGYYVEGPGG